tara:strand:+ start:133 stop:1275 length:1143 start_codon:yes stop_codon:yes gene_type:complete
MSTKEKELTLLTENLPKSIRSVTDAWLDILTDSHLPGTSKYLITDKNDESCLTYAQKIKSTIPSLEIIDFSDVIKFNFEKCKKAAILFLPVLGSGDTFISANRDLRLAGHEGMRIFITLFHLYKGESALKTFEKSLILGPELTKYKFFSQFCLKVPQRLGGSSWELERELYEKYEYVIENTELKSRFELLCNVQNGLNGQIGLNGREHCSPLTFTPHFAFWDFKYDPPKVQPEAVYLTISSILQSARDDNFSKPEESLASTPHQQALLSPDNFVRFNDPLLQSCLWRTSKGAELDYTSDEGLSSDFVSILERLSRSSHTERGEAFPDLLLALVLGKVVLSSNSLKRLKSVISDMDKSNINSTTTAILEILDRELFKKDAV